MKRGIGTFVMGMVLGAVVFGSGAAMAAGLLAEPSAQSFYVDGVKVELEAYVINGNNGQYRALYRRGPSHSGPHPQPHSSRGGHSGPAVG